MSLAGDSGNCINVEYWINTWHLYVIVTGRATRQCWSSFWRYFVDNVRRQWRAVWLALNIYSMVIITGSKKLKIKQRYNNVKSTSLVHSMLSYNVYKLFVSDNVVLSFTFCCIGWYITSRSDVNRSPPLQGTIIFNV